MPSVEAIVQKRERRASRAVEGLIVALTTVGWKWDKAVEVAEQILEEAEKDGIRVDHLWAAIERIAPIPKET